YQRAYLPREAGARRAQPADLRGDETRSFTEAAADLKPEWWVRAESRPPACGRRPPRSVSPRAREQCVHSRLAYVELHDDEKAATVTSFVERGLDWFGRRGISARRLMTHNASPT